MYGILATKDNIIYNFLCGNIINLIIHVYTCTYSCTVEPHTCIYYTHMHIHVHVQSCTYTPAPNIHTCARTRTSSNSAVNVSLPLSDREGTCWHCLLCSSTWPALRALSFSLAASAHAHSMSGVCRTASVDTAEREREGGRTGIYIHVYTCIYLEYIHCTIMYVHVYTCTCTCTLL